MIERCHSLASPVKQFTGPDAPRCQIRLSQRVTMASKGVPGDVPDQRDRERTLAARRFRLLAPLAVALTVAALIVAPGIIGH